MALNEFMNLWNPPTVRNPQAPGPGMPGGPMPGGPMPGTGLTVAPAPAPGPPVAPRQRRIAPGAATTNAALRGRRGLMADEPVAATTNAGLRQAMVPEPVAPATAAPGTAAPVAATPTAAAPGMDVPTPSQEPTGRATGFARNSIGPGDGGPMRAWVGAETDAQARMQNPEAFRTMLSSGHGGGLTQSYLNAADLIREKNLLERRQQTQSLIDQGQYGRGGAEALAGIDEQMAGLAGARQEREMFEAQQQAEMAQRQGARALPSSQLNKATQAGAVLRDYADIMNMFKDDFGGYWTQTIGDTAQAIAKRSPGLAGMLDIDENFNAYWQKVAGAENALRHELFGATLTSGEERAWENMTINSGMSPAEIRKNLQGRVAIMARNALALADTYQQQGYGPEPVYTATGMSRAQLQQLAQTNYPTEAVAAAAAEEAAENQALAQQGQGINTGLTQADIADRASELGVMPGQVESTLQAEGRLQAPRSRGANPYVDETIPREFGPLLERIIF